MLDILQRDHMFNLEPLMKPPRNVAINGGTWMGTSQRVSLYRLGNRNGQRPVAVTGDDTDNLINYVHRAVIIDETDLISLRITGSALIKTRNEEFGKN